MRYSLFLGAFKSRSYTYSLAKPSKSHKRTNSDGNIGLLCLVVYVCLHSEHSLRQTCLLPRVMLVFELGCDSGMIIKVGKLMEVA